MQKIPVLKIETFDNAFTDSNFYANDFAKHIATNSKIVHRPHTHNFYLCVLFTAGIGTHEIDFTRYPIQAGSVFFLSPGQTHFWQFETQPKGYIFFHTLEAFELTLSKQRLENFPFYYSVNNSPTLTLAPYQVKGIAERFEEIYTEYNTTKLYKTEKLTNLINLIYIDLSRLYIPEEHVLESSISATYFTILKAFEKLLDLHFKSEKSASFYAEHLSITTKHLNRVLKTILDKTTTDLIHERTLLEAKRLMVHTENSLREISEILGFEDYAYFSRIFKAKTKQSPKAFKNQYAH